MPNPPGNTPPPPDAAPLAALLSYLVPGLGQIYQGRVAKGFLCMLCVYGLFFYGMALGQWKNVYLPHAEKFGNAPSVLGEGTLNNLYNRPQFLGQFWTGVVAWPALGHYLTKDGVALFREFEKTPDEDELNKLQIQGDKTWDLAWVYTVIAGVLNVLVIYDALAGPAFVVEKEREPRRTPAQEVAPV